MRPAALPALPQVPEREIELLAAQLSAAKNPVIVAEEAGRDVAAVEALVALAEKLGAPVLEAWQPYYLNFPRTHPLYGGIITDDAHPLLKESDFILLAESVLPWHPPGTLAQTTK